VRRQDIVIKNMRIKEFIQKYRKYILTGLVLIILIGVFVLILTQKQPETVSIQRDKKIVSPFMENTKLPNFTLPAKKDLFTEEFLSVYSILPYKRPLAELVHKFDNKAESRYPSEIVDFWMSKSNTFIYYKKTGIFKVSSPYGLPTPFLIAGREDINLFITRYFELTDIDTDNILVEKNSFGGYTYKGKYLINGKTFGSAYLESYAFIIQTDKDSHITNLSILLYNKDSISVYSQYSLLSELELLSNKRVYIDRLTISENYNNLDRYIKGTIRLDSLDVREMQKAYVFTDFTGGFVYPVYIFMADARYKDFHNEVYAADIIMYIMATEQKNISSREDIVEFSEIGTGNQ